MDRIMNDMALPPRSNRNNLVSSTIVIVPRTCPLNKVRLLIGTTPAAALLPLVATPLILSSAHRPHPSTVVGTQVDPLLTCSTHSTLHRMRDLARLRVVVNMVQADL